MPFLKSRTERQTPKNFKYTTGRRCIFFLPRPRFRDNSVLFYRIFFFFPDLLHSLLYAFISLFLLPGVHFSPRKWWSRRSTSLPRRAWHSPSSANTSMPSARRHAAAKGSAAELSLGSNAFLGHMILLGAMTFPSQMGKIEHFSETSVRVCSTYVQYGPIWLLLAD